MSVCRCGRPLGRRPDQRFCSMRCRMRQRRGTLEAAAEDRMEAAARRLVAHLAIEPSQGRLADLDPAVVDLAFAIGELDVVRDLRRIAGRPSTQGRRPRSGRRVVR